MFIISLIFSIFISFSVLADPKLVKGNSNESCVVSPFLEGYYTLKGQIKDFYFTTNLGSPVSFDDHKVIEGVLLPTGFVIHDNMDNIEPGGLVYDQKGTLVAKVGSPIEFYRIKVEEVYCLPSPEEGLPQTVGSKIGATSSS